MRVYQFNFVMVNGKLPAPANLCPEKEPQYLLDKKLILKSDSNSLLIPVLFV